MSALLKIIRSYAPYWMSQITRIISGGARGADLLAEQYAKGKGISSLIFKPAYHKFGRSAPMVRNQQLVDAADLIIAFWDGKSRGTARSLEYAPKKGKLIRIVTFPPASL